MYLKRLEIHGFKTFAERTELHFRPGVIGVIGPNGSGKSNISDAIAWVLGENNVRELRGATAQDIIFAGNDRRKPLGMAEVALTIDNTARILPLDFSEVTVTRRIYRNGETECFINKVACRLRDIYELFLDTGIGRDAYSMVNQGEIDSILSVRAEDRRALFEEAAGVKKYRHRKREAERKLDTTQQNLLRLTDILTEIEAQLGPLARQAAAARRFEEISGKLVELETAWYGTRLRKLAGEAEALAGQLRQLAEEHRRREVEAAQARGREEQARQALAALDGEIDALRSQEAACLEQMAALSASRARADERLRQLQGRLAALAQELVELEQRAEKRKADRDAQEAQAEECAARLKACQIELEEARKRAADLQGQRDRARRELAEQRQRSMELLRRKAEQENRLVSVTHRAQTLTDTATRLAGEHEEAQKVAAETKAATQAAGEQNSGRGEKLQALEAEAAVLARDLKAADERQATIARESEGRRRELAARTGRRQALVELSERGEGAGAGAKSLLNAARKGEIEGTWRLLAEDLNVPKGLERAVEAALGPYAEALVTDSMANALAALEWLRKRGETAVIFAPTVAESESLGARAPGTHEVGGPANPADAEAASALASQVTGQGAVGEVIKTLLADIELCDSLAAVNPSGAQAFQPAGGTGPGAAPAAGSPPRLWVTRTGEWRSATGGVCGGAEAQERTIAAAQARRREIEQLEGEIGKLQSEMQRLEGESAATDTERQELRASVEASRQELARLRAEAETGRREVERLRQELAKAEQRLGRLAADRERTQREAEQARQQLEACQREVGAWSDTDATEQTEMDAVAAAAEQSEQEWRQAEAAVSDLRVRAASLERETESARGEAERLGHVCRQIERDQGARTAERTSLERTLAELTAERQGGQGGGVDLEQSLATTRQRLQTATVNRELAVAKVKETAAGAQGYTGRLQELTERRHRAEIEAAALGSERARIEEQWRGSNAMLGPAEGEPQPDAEDEDEQPAEEPSIEMMLAAWDPQAAEEVLARYPDPDAEVHRLRRQIRSLGAINPDAIEEHAKQQERSQFLGGQKADLESARDQLLGAIQEIDAASKETFQKAFEQIALAFDEMFKKLFHGGTTELVLTDPDNILESGIEVMVQPPGKRRQNLSLLSGGERALTAAAMLFALLKVRPSPFCVMDEVDAPLDEANVARFGETLREFALGTQFIMVTHNRGTMEAADALYGVTMQEKGVSKVLSCTLTDDFVQSVAESRGDRAATQKGVRV